MAEVQNETKEHMAKSSTASEGREKLLEAKIEDLSDRLRLGMGKLQQAIGESSASVGKLAAVDVSNFKYRNYWIKSRPLIKGQPVLEVYQ